MQTVAHAIQVIIGLTILGAYYTYRWKLAGKRSEAMAEERRLAKESFELIRRDPRFETLWRYITSRNQATFDTPADAATYRVRDIELYDATYKRIWGGGGL
jgi:hypothetical protein